MVKKYETIKQGSEAVRTESLPVSDTIDSKITAAAQQARKAEKTKDQQIGALKDEADSYFTKAKEKAKNVGKGAMKAGQFTVAGPMGVATNTLWHTLKAGLRFAREMAWGIVTLKPPADIAKKIKEEFEEKEPGKK